LRGDAHRRRLDERKQSENGNRGDDYLLTHTGTSRSAANHKPGHFIT
jgi:hypothetical protein